MSPSHHLTLTPQEFDLLLRALNLYARHAPAAPRQAVFELARRLDLPLFTDQIEPEHEQ